MLLAARPFVAENFVPLDRVDLLDFGFGGALFVFAHDFRDEQTAIQAAVAAARSSARQGRPAARPTVFATLSSWNALSLKERHCRRKFSAAISIARRKRIPSAAWARMCGLPMRVRSRSGDPTTPI